MKEHFHYIKYNQLIIISPLCLCLSVSSYVFVSMHMRQREKEGERKGHRERQKGEKERQRIWRPNINPIYCWIGLFALFFEREFSLAWIFLIRVGWMVNYLQISLCLVFQVCDYMHVLSCRIFSLQLKGSNSSPHACMASTLLIGPSPEIIPIFFDLGKKLYKL